MQPFSVELSDENGQIDTEIQKIDIVAPKRDGSFTIQDTYNGEPVTPWRYGDWWNASTKIERYTVTAVTALIFSIATAAAPGAAIVNRYNRGNSYYDSNR
ncbi:MULTISPECIES: hypothetical protein [Paenibacillus]|uniref:hypothetical protein n=1 Tax=Paenibacillus TaxID=44249 RepID=UPI002FE3D8B8